MSIPNPPPERQSAYQHPGEVPPPVPPAPVVQPVVQPVVVPVAATQQPPAVFPPAVPAAPVAQRTGPTVDNGRYWAGVVATAVVAALVGVVGVIILDQIFEVDLVVKDVFGTDSVGAAYVVGGALSAVVAGALLQLLVLSTPRPRAFFGWIMFLGIVVAAVIPFTWTDSTKSAAWSGFVNLLVGIAIWSLLTGVLARTLRPGTVVE
jgi:hypothetical protein